MTSAPPLLEARNLKKYFSLETGFLKRKVGLVQAVDGVSFKILNGETFGLVGESGSGKSTVANLALKLLEPTDGEILFQGHSLHEMSPSLLAQYRRGVQVVFQDPYGALSPRMRVGAIISEPLEVHGYPKSERADRVRQVLKSVGLPESSIGQYPHEFSGGQRQRIGIARALVLEPKLIILDEPVSSLDVSIRSQVLNLLMDIQEERTISYLLISHDLAIVERMSTTIGVMYLGKLIEVGDARTLCADPQHPYTASLVSAATPPNRRSPWTMPVLGDVPSLLEKPSGCAFHPRCPYAMSVCKQQLPPLTETGPNRFVACHLYPEHIKTIDKSKIS